MTDIILQGACGRMGVAIQKLVANRDDCRIVAGVDKAASNNCEFPVYSSLDDVAEKADVLIDFSHPDATSAALEFCARKQLPCVICTTGLGSKEKELLDTSAKHTAVFFSANMSIGINLITELAKMAQKVLGGFDIEIVEKHHNNKLDAPSGTALAIADAINESADGEYNYVYDRHQVRQKRDKMEIGIHAVRGGSIVGEHDVIFAGPDEVITLSHQAYSRDVFANGAVAAAVFMNGKGPGKYSMQDLMEK